MNPTNPNQNYFSSGATFNTAIPNSSTTIDASTMSASPQKLNLSGNPTPTDYNSTISAIPTFESITQNVTDTPEATKLKNSQSTLEKLMSSLTGKTAVQQQAEQQTGVTDYTKQLTDLNSQITTIKNEATAIPMQLQNEVQGRGVTTGGLAPIQTGQLRTNAIKALTLNSLAETLRGNLSTAQAAADKAVALQFDPIEQEIKIAQQQIENNMAFFTAAEKRRADLQSLQLNERQRLLDNAKADKATVYNIGSQLAQFGVDNETIQKVLSASSPEEALAYAGSKLQSPEAKMKLESLRLDNVLTKSKIASENYKLSLLKEYGGLTPDEYAKKLKEEKKSIDDAKTESEKQYLQGQALNSKITLLGTVLDSNAIDSVVGPSAFARGAKSIKGEVGRILGGAIAGGTAGSLFAGVGAIPGAIIGGAAAGLQGSKDYFTGSSDKLVGQVEQFISKEFLQNLIDVKAQGATFGALQKTEQDALTAAASFIGQRRIYSGKGEDRQVVGYDMSEADFKRELQTIKELTQKAQERATGSSFSPEDQQLLDKAFGSENSPANYFQ